MKLVKAAALSTSLLAAAAIGTSAFGADVSVTFDPGIVAYGYTDGYWTNKHEWRTWEKPEYVEVYRKHPGARYYEYRHDRDADMGWRGDVVIHK
jgi:hypothetical protein